MESDRILSTSELDALSIGEVDMERFLLWIKIYVPKVDRIFLMSQHQDRVVKRW